MFNDKYKNQKRVKLIPIIKNKTTKSVLDDNYDIKNIISLKNDIINLKLNINKLQYELNHKQSIYDNLMKSNNNISTIEDRTLDETKDKKTMLLEEKHKEQIAKKKVIEEVKLEEYNLLHGNKIYFETN
tara:strand:+ start:6762 stop:7148 length:387 start_codon:yes stop_codon:yes gene_type:complete